MRLVEERRLPPVDQWNPAHCGASEMRIAADGTWFHQGSPIGRPAMVQLFSSVLRREQNGGYVLVTPVEKLDIAVEDAPFVAVELRHEGKGQEARLIFRLNTNELVVADAAHPLRFDHYDEGPRPYLTVRSGLDALIARSVYYDIVHLASDQAQGGDVSGIWSGGTFFPFFAE